MEAGLRSGEGSSAPISEMGTVAAVVIDDQELTRRGIERVVSAAGIQVVGEARSAEEGVQLALTFGRKWS
jgi:hypothetical protein